MSSSSSSEGAVPPSSHPHPSKDTAPTKKAVDHAPPTFSSRRGVSALSVASPSQPNQRPSLTADKTASKTPHGQQQPGPLITPSTAATVSTAASSTGGAPSTGKSTALLAASDDGVGQVRGGSPTSPETPWHIRKLPSTPGSGGSLALTPSATDQAGPQHPSPAAPGAASARPFSDAIKQGYSASQLRQQEQLAQRQFQKLASTSKRPIPTKQSSRKRKHQPAEGALPQQDEQPSQKRKRAAPSFSGGSSSEDSGKEPSAGPSKAERGGEERSGEGEGGAANDLITRRGESAPSEPPSSGEGEESEAEAGARINSHRRRFGRPPSMGGLSTSSGSRRKARKDMGAPLHHFFPLPEQVIVQPHMELDVRRLPERLQPSVHSPMMQSASAASSGGGDEQQALVAATPPRRSSPRSSLGGADETTPSSTAASMERTHSSTAVAATSSGESPEEEAKRLKQSQTLDAVWWQRFEELKAFRAAKGHCRVPQRYTASPALGRWVARQRTEKRMLMERKPSTLTEEREKALQGIQFDWVVREK
mmetsp:Transcript_35346/g.105577  ORF Transcript_35346/g.105577 Transcript_35346/m.105577 type:complete len:536 (-) Transcript_35346:138-1745(-)